MPTIDEQLAGALRLLDRVDDELAVHARRLLLHVARSWADERDFHDADNVHMTELLQTFDVDVPAATGAGVRDLADRNATLRRSLAGLADDVTARTAVARHLRERLDADPTWRENP